MSGTLNPLIYQLSNKPAVALQSPLDMLGQAGQTVNVLNQNRLFQAQQAAGQAFQQSIDPTTGLPSQNRLGINLSQLDPQNAIAVPGALEQGQTLAGQQQNVAQARNQVIGSMLGSVLNAPDDQLHSVAASTLDRAVTMGLIPQQQATAFALKLPNDPTALRTTLDQMQKSLLAPSDQRTQTYGVPSTQNDGQTLTSGVTAPASQGGGFSPGSSTQLQTGPETNAGLIETYQPDPKNPGQYIKVMLPRSALPGANGVAGQGAGPAGNGRYPAPQSAPAQAGGTAAPAQTSQSGPILAAPPGNVQANNEADVGAFKKDQLAVPAIATTTLPNLQHAYDALQTIGTGPSTEAAHNMWSLLNAQGLLPAGVSDDIKNYDLFRKYTEKYALDQAGNTDAGRAMSAASNAGAGISTPANMDVLRNEIGKQRQIVAQVMAAPDQTGLGYGAHVAQFTSQRDPRGFAIDTYSPQDLQKLMKSMPNDAARNRFWRAAGTAQRLGLVNGPQVAAPATAPQGTAQPPAAPPPPDVPTGY